MAEISIPWGEQPLAVALPADWSVQQVAASAVPPASPDWAERLAGALNKPEGSPPLEALLRQRGAGKLVLIVEDATRHSPLPAILPVILRELEHAGVPDADVEIFFACGMHPPMTPAEAEHKLGPDLARRFAWRSNQARQRDPYVHLGRVRAGGIGGGSLDLEVDRGVLEAGLRLIISSVTPHLQAGFGGGYKMLVPGCASIRTIAKLHAVGVPRRPRQQVGQAGAANRMRALIDAAGAAVDAAGGRTFGVQYLLDATDQVSAVAAGDVPACQEMLAKQCAAGCGVLLDAQADVVVTNAWPRDYDLWQSLKSVANTRWAARPGGVIICLTRCLAGVNTMPIRSIPVSPRMVRGLFRLVGADSLAGLLIRLFPELNAEAAFFVRLAAQTIQRNPIIVVSPALAEAGAKFVGLPIVATAEEAVALAQAELGRGPQRVVVFPTGGVSYPILRKN